MTVYEYKGVTVAQNAAGLIVVTAPGDRVVALTTDIAHAVRRFMMAVRA